MRRIFAVLRREDATPRTRIFYSLYGFKKALLGPEEKFLHGGM